MPEYISTITGVISNLGFPIAMVLIMAWYVNKQATDHKEEVSKMTDAINNNTLALSRILEKLGE